MLNNSLVQYRLTKKICAGMTVSPRAPGDKEHGVLAVQFFLCVWIQAWVAEQTLLSSMIGHSGLVLRAK